MVNWMFRDRTTGKIVIGQNPNVLLGLFLVALAVRYGLALFDTSHHVQRIASFVMFGFLSLWALDELFRGVNPFRRFLGAGVLIFVAWSVYTLI